MSPTTKILPLHIPMTNNIVKAIYSYIVPRAIPCKKTNPFKISLTQLFEQNQINVPKYKSLRYKIMAGNKKTIISQLNNVPIKYQKDDILMSCHKKLMVSLEDTQDGKDYKLCAWNEKTT